MTSRDKGFVLGFNEIVLFDAKAIFPKQAIRGIFLYSGLAFGAIFAGFCTNVFSAVIGSFFAKGISVLASLFCPLVSALFGMEATVGRYVMTNTRIRCFSRNERAISGRDDFRLDFDRDCLEAHVCFDPIVKLPIVKEESGHPEWYFVKGISAADLARLSTSFRTARGVWVKTLSTNSNIGQIQSDPNLESRSE